MGTPGNALEGSKRLTDVERARYSARHRDLYRGAGSPHADTLLMAYFQKERILVDVYNPGATVIPFAPNLLENITKRKLRIDRIVPLHAAIGPYSEFVNVVQPAKATTN